MTKSRPVLIIFSILAGLQVLTAGATLGDVIGAKAAAFVVLASGAVQAAMSFYVSGQVTPNENVAAVQNPQGVLVAGPAAGPTNGTPVDVSPSRGPPND